MDYLSKLIQDPAVSSYRILLSEGSSLSARQVITTLGLKGHRIEVCDPDPLCIGRFSGFVRKFHRCPGLGSDPAGYLQFLLDLLRSEKFDVLLPTHEQCFLLAKVQGLLAPLTGIALPHFESYIATFSKAAFSRLLMELGLPQPQTKIINSAAELHCWALFPAVIKTAIGTASRGIRFVRNRRDLELVVNEFSQTGEFEDEIVVQEMVAGPVERAQAVFRKGRLAGFHAYRQVAEGVGGGDRIKESVHRPDVLKHLMQIGRRLYWHGALSVDYIFKQSEKIPLYIDCNPRLVEPVNAFVSGVDLAGILAAVSLGKESVETVTVHKGVRTHMAIQGFMRCALQGRSRRGLLSEARHIWNRSGDYVGSREELTPVSADPWSILPLAYVAVRMLIFPQSVWRLSQQTAKSHQLNRNAVRTILEKIEAVPLSSDVPNRA